MKIINKMDKLNTDIIATNKHANFEFIIKHKFEAGIVLLGWEVNSLRTGNINIKDSYVAIINNEAFLLCSNFVPLVKTTNCYFYDKKRTRKLLLHKNELNFLYGNIKRKGYTAVALSMYWKNHWCKVQVGIVLGKKKYEKRFDIKKREWHRLKTRIQKNVTH